MSEVNSSVRVGVVDWERLICNKNEIGKSKHDDKGQEHEGACVGKSLHDESNEISVAGEQSKQIEDLKPHEEHRPGSN